MNISKIVLGTVQLGLDYGINNPRGKPSKSESLAMLERAHERGIRVFDTAFGYGEAEEIIGDFIAVKKLGDQVRVISKLEPNCVPEKSGDVLRIVESGLRASLRRLGRTWIDGYLLHTSSYIFREEIVNALNECKANGLVKNIGVSVYEEAEALAASQSPFIDYIQIPYSVFDQRLDHTDFFSLAKANGKKVFARTAFLQGLIFMAEEKIPERLSEVKKHLRILDDIILRYGLSRLQAALLFPLSKSEIEYIVFGVDTMEQLNNDIDAVSSLAPNPECVAELQKHFSRMEKSLVFPSLWKK